MDKSKFGSGFSIFKSFNLELATTNLESSIKLLAKLREQSGDSISAFEYFDRACIDALMNKEGIKDIFDKKYEHYVLVELSSSQKNSDLNQLLENSIALAIEDKNVNDAIVASNETQSAQFWSLRETLPVVLKNIGKYIVFETKIAKRANIAAPKVEITITNLLSYMSDIFPTGNCETAPEIANKNVTIDISSIEKFIEAAYTANKVNKADCIVP